MGWILALAFIIVAAMKGDISGDMALIASAIFAVAGAIGSVAVSLKPKQEEQNKE